MLTLISALEILQSYVHILARRRMDKGGQRAAFKAHAEPVNRSGGIHPCVHLYTDPHNNLYSILKCRWSSPASPIASSHI
jgi:hypothetical protein